MDPRIAQVLATMGIPNPERVHLPPDVVFGWVRFGGTGADAAGMSLGATAGTDLTAANSCKSEAVIRALMGGTSKANASYAAVIAGYRVVASATSIDDAEAGDLTLVQDWMELAAAQYIQHQQNGGSQRFLDCCDCLNDAASGVAVATGNAANDIHVVGAQQGTTWIPHDPLYVDIENDTFTTATRAALTGGHEFLGYVDVFGLFFPNNLISKSRNKANLKGGADTGNNGIRTDIIKFLSTNVGKTSIPGI